MLLRPCVCSARVPLLTAAYVPASCAALLAAPQVGGNGSYAWGDKWWEKAFDSAVQTVDQSDSSDSSDSDSGGCWAALLSFCCMCRC